MDWVIRRAAGGQDEDEPNGDNVVRLRGLPYEATKQDIVSIFDGTFVEQKLLSSNVKKISHKIALIWITFKSEGEDASDHVEVH